MNIQLKLTYRKHSQKGITLIEIVITLLICAFVSFMVFNFVNMTGNKISQLSESIPLQQQVNIISEAFCRSVRSSNHVTAGKSSLPPGTAVSTDTIITRNAQGVGIDTFIMANNTVTLNHEDCFISSVNTPIVGNASSFKLSEQGKSATLNLEMFALVNKDTITVPPIEEMVRCRQ